VFELITVVFIIIHFPAAPCIRIGPNEMWCEVMNGFNWLRLGSGDGLLWTL